jgi:hypothetical protein
MSKPRFEVTVSNVGVFYTGHDIGEATAMYDMQASLSLQAIGSVAGEDVTLSQDGEPVTEYVGALSFARDRANKKMGETCYCLTCIKSRAIFGIVSGGTKPTVKDTAYALAYSITNKIDGLRKLHVEDKDKLVTELVDVLQKHLIIKP